jgi:mRNA interferase MazF
MNKGEIYLARFPLAGSGGVKARPVLVLTGLVGPVPEVLTAYISSVIPTQVLPSDLIVDPTLPAYASAGLKTVSVVRLHKQSTLHQRDVFRLLGALTPAVLAGVDVRLRVLLGL